MLELCADDSIDLFLIIGGYNSSNTTHLAEIAGRHKPSYHIYGPDCIISADAIRHKPPGGREEEVRTGWLPKGPCTVGMTSGASTPDSDLGATIKRLFDVRGIPLEE
jgi:4-hydroxy-3-methylbut-2-enyl diphosphate reductase